MGIPNEVSNESTIEEKIAPTDLIDYDADDYYSWFIEFNSTSGDFSPEQRLMLAVLGDAIWCAQLPDSKKNGKKSNSNKLLRKNAIRWLFNDRRNYYFSLSYICDAVNIDVSEFKSTLRRKLDNGGYKFDMRELTFWIK